MTRRPLTEGIHPAAEGLERLPTLELLRLMNAEDRKVPRVVGAALAAVARVVDASAERLAGGGHLHYFGAGSSGRLAVLDAAECPPTFGVSPDLVVAHLAGGERALTSAVEEAEDSADQGYVDVLDARIAAADAVIGVAASGQTPYVLGAMRGARQAGAFTAGIACVRGSSLEAAVEGAIPLPVGPEVVAGSTRLKAGTAQKLVLNMISTAIFTRLGHVHRGRMIDVRPNSAKLRRRAVGMVAELAAAPAGDAERALDAAGGNARLAVLMATRRLDRRAAEAALAAAAGDLGRALAGG